MNPSSFDDIATKHYRPLQTRRHQSLRHRMRKQTHRLQYYCHVYTYFAAAELDHEPVDTAEAEPEPEIVDGKDNWTAPSSLMTK